jgi:hypothetical protein
VIGLGLERATYAHGAGALTLFAHGLVVNKSGLDFNRLMGVYIAIFFVVSQVISFILFKQISDDMNDSQRRTHRRRRLAHYGNELMSILGSPAELRHSGLV